MISIQSSSHCHNLSKSAQARCFLAKSDRDIFDYAEIYDSWLLKINHVPETMTHIMRWQLPIANWAWHYVVQNWPWLIWAKTIPAKMHTTDLLLITKMPWYTWKGPQRCFGRKWLHLAPFCNYYHIIPTWCKDLVRNMFRGFLTLSNSGCSSLLARAAALRILFLRTMRTGASAWCRSCRNNPV